MKEYKSDEVNVTVTAADKNDLPEDAELVVEPIELSEKTEKKVEEAALKEKRTVKKVHAYDIHFELYGEEIQPGASVQVSVDVPGISAGQNAAVFHVDDNNKVENMNGDVDKKVMLYLRQIIFQPTLLFSREVQRLRQQLSIIMMIQPLMRTEKRKRFTPMMY